MIKTKYTHDSIKVNKNKYQMLLLPKSHKYPIDLTYENTTAKLLDTLLHVNRKPWATPELMKALLDAVEDACRDNFNNGAQGVYCPFGRYMHINWKAKETHAVEIVEKCAHI